jgi:hypothetical protein
VEVRIIDVPPGEAPLWVRKAWVGLVLPLAQGESGPRRLPGAGVRTGPRTLLGSLWRLLFDPPRWTWQYVVDVDEAIDILAEADPEAAAWWEDNTPHLIGRGKRFGFAEAVCEELD